MGKEKIFENEIYNLWKADLTDSFESVSGGKIKIIERGQFNSNLPGPDFKNAKVAINNNIFSGNIEIDVDYNDWFLHGHYLDKKYNTVILHVSLFNKKNKKFVTTQSKRRVHTICLQNILGKEVFKKLQNKISPKLQNNNKLKCVYNIEILSHGVKENFIKSLGVLRFQKKCDKMYNRLKELLYMQNLLLHEPSVNYQVTPEFNNRKFSSNEFYDKAIWQQLFYETIFEALGYTVNKKPMVMLAKFVNINFLQNLENDSELISYIESALFGVAGLIPNAEELPLSEISEYSKKLFTYWGTIKEIYDGETLDETDWQFYRTRPNNFPTIRIAGGAKILKKIIYNKFIETIIDKIVTTRDLKLLCKELRKIFVLSAEGYWKNHFIFDDASKSNVEQFIGEGRADEIVINVVLPFFTLYFDIFGNSELSKKTLKVYNIYVQKSDNKIVRNMGKDLKLEKFNRRTIYSQGLLELYNNYCKLEKCRECNIGKIIFN